MSPRAIPAIAERVSAPGLSTADRLGRPLGELRISVTDRCNLRCRYCMPREHFDSKFRFLPRAELLSFEELGVITRVLASMGVHKARLTGGEPLLRHELPVLVSTLARVPGLDLALTTNGILLPALAAPLKRAGLGRITVSLDALDDGTFGRMSDSRHTPAEVLAGIAAASEAGLTPVKINCVVKRGVNEHAIVPLVERFRHSGHVVRFIEYMDVGTTNAWRMQDVVSGDEIVARIAERFPLEPIDEPGLARVARRFTLADGSGEIGVITSVTRPFCSGCTRLRLSSEGKLFTCLYAQQGHDLREVLRGGASPARLEAYLAEIWRARSDRYSELRTSATAELRRPEMSYIGG